MKKNLQRGETLVEAIIGLAIVAAIATGIVAAVIAALSGTRSNQDSNFALNFAREGSDLVKDLYTSDLDTFVQTYTGGYYCLDQKNELAVPDNSDESHSCPNNGTNITLQNGGGNYLRKVYINEMGCDPPGRSVATCQGTTPKCTTGVFVASRVSWSDSKCKNTNNPNCHAVEIDSCLTDLDTLPNP